MFVVTEADAAAIRAAYQQRGEFAAAVELRQRFPGITDNAQARECVRTIAGWKPLPLRPVKRAPRYGGCGNAQAPPACAGAVVAARFGFIPPRLSRSRSSLPAFKNGFVFSVTDTRSPVRVTPPHREGAEPPQLDALAASPASGRKRAARRWAVSRASSRISRGKHRRS